jgi:hypothetical protein
MRHLSPTSAEKHVPEAIIVAGDSEGKQVMSYSGGNNSGKAVGKGINMVTMIISVANMIFAFLLYSIHY